MAKALKFHAVVRGGAVRLPDLGAWEGKRVEVIVVEDEAELAPAEGSAKRPLGLLRGQLVVPENLNEPLPPDIQRSFDGEGDDA